MAAFIKSVLLPKSIFHDEVFIPRRVNLIIGRNGTGKSTLARTMRDTQALTFAEGVSPADCAVHIFDRTFVDDNIGLYTAIPGIITVSSQNGQIYERILALKDRQINNDSELAGLYDGLRNVEAESKNEHERFRDSCWNNTKSLRKRFGKALTNKKTKQKFAEAVLCTSPISHDKNDLEKLYDAVFDENSVQHKAYNTICNVNVLDGLRGSELIGIAVIGSGDSLFSRFMKKIGAVDWIRHGHAELSHSAGNVCPYCQQALPADFEEQLAACFDEEYERNIAELRRFYDSYRNAANEMFIPLQDNIKEQNRFPDADHRLLLGHMQLLKQMIKANLETIQRKLQSPSAVLSLEPTRPVMEQIRSDIEDINSAISEKNLMVQKKTKLQNECIEKVMELIAYRLQGNISEHRVQTEQTDHRRNTLSEHISICIKQSKDLSEQIRALSNSVRDTSTAAAHINELLAETGFTDFSLKQCEHSDNKYEVVRGNGERVAALSDGEKRFLAFVYFCHLIQSEPEKSRSRVIVLDDPFAELDGSTAQTVLSLTEKLISDDDVQSFVLTCNESCFADLGESIRNSSRETETVICRLEKQNGRTTIKH